MKPLLITLLISGFMILSPTFTRAGLYDSGKKDVTIGDLNDQDYWWTKFDMMMLDKAIENKEPEGPIAVNLASTLQRLDKLSKDYPKHEEIKKWKDHANDINKQIDPNANRSAPWKPGCPWEEANFAQAWVNFHWGKMQLAEKQEDEAFGSFANVKQNFDILLQPDRMKDYPDDLRRWVEDSKKELDQIYPDLKAKTHH